MSGQVLKLARRLLVGREETLARRWQVRMSDVTAGERRTFERRLSITAGQDRVLIAIMRGVGGEWRQLGIEADRLVGLRAAIAGGTNSGKSSWLIGVLIQLFLADRYPIILFDAKGETADAVVDYIVPFLLSRGIGLDLLDRLRVVRVFDRQYVPLLNLTLPQPGVPKEAQAYAVASAVEQALAEPLGGRMHHVLVRLLSLCVEQGWPITRVQGWLEDPSDFVRSAEQSRDAALRQYARVAFRNENKESLRALAARLNALLFWPGARMALCAPGAISFRDALAQPGITVVNTGSPPAGAERLARFFSAALVGQVVRSLLDREVREDTPPALFVAEEIQEALDAEQARQFGRLLATARFKRAAVWITNQSRSQLHAVDPGLVAAMRANVELHVQFRSSPEDAAAFAYMLPQERAGEAARRDLVNSLARLPQRHCYLAVRDIGLRAQQVVAPRIDFEALRSHGRAIAPDLQARIRRGIATVRVEDMREPDLALPPVGTRNGVARVPSFSVEDGRFPELG